MNAPNKSTSPTTNLNIQHILLSDDDEDDCLLFKDALAEVQPLARLTTVNNGEKLLQLLNNMEQLPHILFLDINMPRKNGMQCLLEIKATEMLKELPVIMFSTSFEKAMVALLYNAGAQDCIQKPNEFAKLKEVIFNALMSTLPLAINCKPGAPALPPEEEFVLS